ncbi:MAG: YdiU family protein [Methylococcales bacterium]|nr:YdiU family protein [Methylococcales bacterium]
MTSFAKITQLDDLTFDNRFIRDLPADEEPLNTRRQVFGACYSRVLPTQVVKPHCVIYAQEVADLLDLSPEVCVSDEFTQVFAGNRLAEGMEAYATCYGGHQFGNWAGQLGDGRAINLGDVINQRGERWALQLKGAGATPYSRGSDGLAVLRSSVREFLCSEAMYHLGVPTTRALSLSLTGEQVVRDMFYDGNPRAELGAVVCRVAPSFTRFGHFQILAARSDEALLKTLADYTIRTDFPELGEPSIEVYGQWFTEICRRTAEMVVQWQRVGFVHGVMNTDNMSILGLTIDYGPYGWLENYDPEWTPNTTDAEERRYRFGNQPAIAFWNLVQLANALYPLIKRVEPLKTALTVYEQTFEQGWQAMMAAKLGLSTFDEQLCGELLAILPLVETDMTLFYRKLALVNSTLPVAESVADAIHQLSDAYYVPEQLTADYLARLTQWLTHYIHRLQQEGVADDSRRVGMNAVNPIYVLRNYLAQLAIDDAEQGDFAKIHELLDLLRNPYNEQADKQQFAAKRPDWARQRAGCSMLSCSS